MLAPLNRRIAAAQVTQFIEGNGPGMIGGKAVLATSLDTIATSAPGFPLAVKSTHQKKK
jgi:hypothetical protein